MHTRTNLLLGGLLALSGPALAQDVLPLPFSSTEPGPVEGSLDLEVDRALIEYAHGLEQMVLEGFPVPNANLYDLDLRRVHFDFSQVGVYVDGRRSSYDPGDLSLWLGEIVGVPGSEVFLALSSKGTYGWVHDGIDRTHLTSTPGPRGDWSQPGARIFTDRALLAAPGDGPEFKCMLDDLPPVRMDDGGNGDGSGGGPLAQTLECKVAVETDYQLFQVWGNLGAMQTYVMALIGAVSDRYLEQIDVILTYPYLQFYTNPNDPWTEQDSGGNCIDVLYEFQGAWQFNIPAGAHLAWFLSGASLGCGVAWLDVLCNPEFGFAVSGNINGGVTFPVMQGANNWDFMVFAHEGGHNFGSPHTHDFCPPLDKCSSNNCEGGQVCTSSGTIMSYCHQCPGGLANITTYFHPTVVNLMRTEADNSCLPDFGGGGTTLFFEDFESGSYATNGWTTSLKKAKVKGGASYNGSFGGRLIKGGGGTPQCQVATNPNKEAWAEAPSVDTTGYSAVQVKLATRGKNTETGCEYLDLQWWNGASWQSAGQFENLTWTEHTVNLPAGAAGNPNLRLRVISNARGSKEKFDFDDFEVIGD